MIESFANNKPVKEATYLNTENSQRYRTIIQIMFKKYEQMKYWILKEEIYEIIKNIYGFENYTMDNLKQDLDSLEYWGNVITMQDTKKTRTLEEFKNRQFRYQISSVTIELERALIKIQNQKHTSRGSLEVSLIEKFKNTLIEIKKIDSYSNKEIYTWWQNLNNEFKNLNENYQDYISEFFMPKIEDILKTTEFLIFKEGFIKYLKDFIYGIQQNMNPIREILEDLKDDYIISNIIQKTIDYEEEIRPIGEFYNKEEAYEIHFGRFQSIKQWFISVDIEKSMVELLLDSTNEIIKKITRYALQISQMQYSLGNRKDEYKKIIDLFSKCREVDDAHKLSSIVFGVSSTKHIICDKERETESISSSIHDEEPKIITVKPSIRSYKEKTASKVPIKNNKEKKKKLLIDIIKKRKEEEKLIRSRIKDNSLKFRELEGLSKEERLIFLSWLSQAINENSNSWCKNQFGKHYKLKEKKPEKYIILKCIDGDLIMPDYELIFKEE